MWQRLLAPGSPTEDWLVAIHTIKGSARGIGAWDLAEACSSAEEAAGVDQFGRDGKRAWGELVANRISAVQSAIAVIRHELAIRSLRA
jgi:HPt (histidine-containing phosphotransfer) domain-containing protein